MTMKIANEIKKTKNLSLKTYFLSSFLISNRISPYISSIYIKRKVLPNTITIHMILSGVIGAVFFSMPNIYIKILGALFIHLWFILDCSDGEVARYTKTFSKFGKELDYMAHLIDHPLFGFALLMSLMQLNRYNITYLIMIILMSNLADYFNRNICALNVIIELKEPLEGNGNNFEKWTLKKRILFITNIFTIYPNFILFGVIIYFIDFIIGSDILYIYLIANVVLTIIFAIREMIRYTKKFYIS